MTRIVREWFYLCASLVLASACSSDAFRPIIHRFDRDGKLVSSRWFTHEQGLVTAASPLRNMLHVVDDRQVMLRLK